MPQFLEKILEREATKKGKTGRAADRYVYGALNNMKAMHGNKITPKGEAMERKHERDMRAGRAQGQRRVAIIRRPK